MSVPLFVGGPWHGRRYNTWEHGHYPDTHMVIRHVPATVSMIEAPEPDTSMTFEQVFYRLRWWTRGRDPLAFPHDPLPKFPVYVTGGTERYGQGHSAADPYDRALADFLLGEVEFATLPICVVPDCTEKAPLLFIASEYGRLAGRSWEPGNEIRVCPQHGGDIYAAMGVHGLDELAEWLRPDSRLDTLDAFDAATDLIHGQEIAHRRARSLRVQAAL